MLKRLIILLLLSSFIILTTQACIRLKSVTHQRVDQELDGNQGCLVGDPIPKDTEPRKKTKTFLRLEVNLSEYDEFKPARKEEKPPAKKEESKRQNKDVIYEPGTFNKGYLVTKDTQDEVREVDELTYVYTDKVVIEQPSRESTFTTYTVKKGETLWDIAARPEIYGNPAKWHIIYEANKKRIKKPNLIRPGMKLKIPR